MKSRVKIQHGTTIVTTVADFHKFTDDCFNLSFDGHSYKMPYSMLTGRSHHGKDLFDVSTMKSGTQYVVEIVIDKGGTISKVEVSDAYLPIECNTTDGNKTMTHPSWGIISLSRPSGNVGGLFMTDNDHPNYYDLNISQATVNNTGGTTRYDDKYIRSGKLLTEVRLTREQLFTLLFNMNSGEVPCTIKFSEGEYINYEHAEFNTLKQRVKNLIREYIEGSGALTRIITDIDTIFAEKLTAANKNKVEELLRNLRGHLKDEQFWQLTYMLGEYEKAMTEKFLNKPETKPAFIKIPYTSTSKAFCNVGECVIGTISCRHKCRMCVGYDINEQYVLCSAVEDTRNGK